MKKILVIYHGNCPDGFGAAWAAWKKFGSTAEYAPVKPEQLPKTTLKNREIYAVDICYRVSVQKKLRENNKKFVVIDHHVSREADTRHFPENVFDNDHSGAVLTWKYFHPKKPLPRLLRYVEGGDLWRFTLPHIRDVSPYMYTADRTFPAWNVLEAEFRTARGFRGCIEKGKLLRDYEEKAIVGILKRAYMVRFEKKKVYAINSSMKNYVSELGARLVKKHGPLALVWYEDTEGLKVSLRADGKVDVSKIAMKYGGGGHKNAASFIIKDFKKPWTRIKS